MCHRITCSFLLGAMAISASADIVWSGLMDERVYHDVQAIDFNQDGTDDIEFNYTLGDLLLSEYTVTPLSGQVVIDDLAGFLAPNGTPLIAGTVIDSNLNNPDIAWEGGESLLFFYLPMFDPLGAGGEFSYGEGYLGASFDVGDSTHYGWVLLSHDTDLASPDREYLYIKGWAWETQANTAIIAGAIPEPSTGILTMVGTFSLLYVARTRCRRQAKLPSIPKGKTLATIPPDQW